jgi:hypothetical protein
MITQQTSHDALESLKKDGRLGATAQTVLAQIRIYGGSTCDEIEYRLGMRHQTASSAIRSLVQQEILRASKQKRRTRSGREAIVWVVATPEDKQLNLFD